MLNVDNISNPTFLPAIESDSNNFEYFKKKDSEEQKQIRTDNKDIFIPNGFRTSEETDYKKQINGSSNKFSASSKVKENEEKADKSKLNQISASGKELTEEEKKSVEKLKEIDRKVRAHEQAHKSAGAGLVRGSSYTEKTGPNGKKYATAGEVQIDISKVSNNPQATIRKMEQVIRAALAPADPSMQDRMVAARARAISSEARTEIYSQNNEDSNSTQKAKNPLDVYKNKGTNSQKELGNIFDFSDAGENTGSLKNILKSHKS